VFVLFFLLNSGGENRIAIDLIARHVNRELQKVFETKIEIVKQGFDFVRVVLMFEIN